MEQGPFLSRLRKAYKRSPFSQQIAQDAALDTWDPLSGRAGNIWKKASALGGEGGALRSAAGEMV